MFVELLIALTCLFFQPTINHFIGNFDECTASKVCNHTWTPVCGNLEDDSSHRLFLDDCDLHEYNCDNNTTYVEVDAKVCESQCTQSDHANAETTPMTTTSTPKVSTIEVNTEGTKTETTTVTSTKKVTEMNKDKTDTSTDFVAPTTLTTATEETKTTRQTSEITTQTSATTQPTEKTVNTNDDTPTDITTVTEKTTARDLTLPTTTDANVINEDENTIPEDTIEAHNKTTSDATTTKHNGKPDCRHCSLPSTWETTAVGETRDFVQILKERFGDRVKILRDTTHYPKNPTYARKRLAFIPGYHMERRKRRFH